MPHIIPVMTIPSDGPAPDVTTGSIFFIGNATVLIRYAGFTILTDPTFIHRHEQVSLGYGLNTTRLTNPAIDIYELPPLDLIVLSHFHGDHFDQVAERELAKSVPIVTTPEAVHELGQRGFGHTYPLDPWASMTVAKGDAHLRITAMPGQHGPQLADLVLPDVMGSLLEFQAPAELPLFRLYITGDTLVIDALQDAASTRTAFSYCSSFSISLTSNIVSEAITLACSRPATSRTDMHSVGRISRQIRLSRRPTY